MQTWIKDALDLLGSQPRVALVSIVEVAGSAPREAGAKMLVTPHGALGTIGGGALEHACIAQAREMLVRPDERGRAQDYPLGPLLGQCCGGRVRMALEVLTPNDREWLAEAQEFETKGKDYQLMLPIDAGARGAKSGWPPDISDPAIRLLDEAGAVVDTLGRKPWRSRIEFSRPRARHVLLIGGGHVGAALACLLRQLPVQLDWIDSRAGPEPDGAAMGGARLSTDPVHEVAHAAPNTIFLIMTHSHALDFDLVAAVLRRGDALYCGVIGSKTKRRRFLNRLATAGFSEAQRGALVCPIGATELASKEPSVIALSAAMEIMLRFEAHETQA